MKRYKNIKTFQKALRKSINNSGDYINISGIIYTMDYYDLDGKLVTYANIKHNKRIFVKTYNRYKDTKDAEVILEELTYRREDISYYE